MRIERVVEVEYPVGHMRESGGIGQLCHAGLIADVQTFDRCRSIVFIWGKERRAGYPCDAPSGHAAGVVWAGAGRVPSGFRLAEEPPSTLPVIDGIGGRQCVLSPILLKSALVAFSSLIASFFL